MFSLLSKPVKYWKNGKMWWSKLFAHTIGEPTYDRLRLHIKAMRMQWYYTRQQYLYELFQQAPGFANTIGIYPKEDHSHGFPGQKNYELYRDWQENSPNSDGAFAWLILVFGV